MKYEYREVVLDKGERVEISLLNDLGNEGYKLVGILPFTIDTSGSKYPDGTGWIECSEDKVQLIFAREVA